MALPPIMIYGDDVTHILTEEGIANLLLCRSDEEREQAIRGVAGYTRGGPGARPAHGREPARPRRHPPAGGPRHRHAPGHAQPAGRAHRCATWCAPRAACTSRPSASATGSRRFDDERRSRRARNPGLRFPAAAGRRLRAGAGRRRRLRQPRGADRAAPTAATARSRVETSARGFGAIWQAVLSDFHARHPLAGVRVSINDMGATPAVVSLRLDQAVAEIDRRSTAMIELSPNARRASGWRCLLDAGSFHEWLPPAERVTSPHLAQLGVPSRVRRRRGDRPRARSTAARCSSPRRKARSWAAASARCMAPSWSACCSARCATGPTAVLLLAESGGVRLHEANAGLIAVSEVMRALLDVRAAGIPVIVLIGGANGCFGGMGIVARCADHVVMSDVGRLAMSGPEVIEASHGVEEFDSRDRALVWRTTGGKHRYLTRRLRRAGRRRRRRVSRGGDRGARRVAAADAWRRSRPSTRCSPRACTHCRRRATATKPSRSGAPRHRRRASACLTSTSTPCARCARSPEEHRHGLERPCHAAVRRRPRHARRRRFPARRRARSTASRSR